MPLVDFLLSRMERQMQVIEVDQNILRLQVKMHLIKIIKVSQSVANLVQNKSDFICGKPSILSFLLETGKTASVAELDKETDFVLFC